MGFLNLLGKMASGILDEAERKQADIQKKAEKQITTYESKINAAEKSTKMANPEYAKMVNEAKAKLETAKGNGHSTVSASNSNRRAPETGYEPLKGIQDSSRYKNKPGVYILKLNGSIMKVGSAKIGVQKRMQQYYGLNEHCGLNGFINKGNRDNINVTFQHCPVDKCEELESKLFDKYGGVENMPWAKRRPNNNNNTYSLKI